MADQAAEDPLVNIASADAVPRVARYLSDKLDRVMTTIREDTADTRYGPEEVARRADALLEATEGVARLSAAAGYWAPPSTTRVWGGILAALVPGRQSGGVSNTWEQLATYPAVLVAYAFGIGASAARRYDQLAWLFATPVPNDRNEWRPLAELIHPYTIDERVGPGLRDAQFKLSPFSDHLHIVTRPLFHELLPRDEHFEREFDRFELLVALARYQLSGAGGADAWVPLGRVLRLGRYSDNVSRKLLEDEPGSHRGSRALLRLLGCDASALDETIDGFHAAVAKQMSQVIFIR